MSNELDCAAAAHLFHNGFNDLTFLTSVAMMLSVLTQFLTAELSDPIATFDQHQPHTLAAPASAAVLMPDDGDA